MLQLGKWQRSKDNIYT